MSENAPDQDYPESRRNFAQKDSFGGNCSGRKEKRGVSVCQKDKTELQRIVAERRLYAGIPQVLWDYLDRSLLGRIQQGRYSPRKFAVEIGQRPGRGQRGEKEHDRSCERTDVQARFPSWAEVEEAARLVNADLDRFDRRLARRGSVFPFPFFRCEAQGIVQAAMREIATANREGKEKLLSTDVVLEARDLREAVG
ncbi:hypothetical protein GGP79_003054 [Salinibacter ruber]|jgi:hypothetical protein|uniref:hypothetical protein n=1 Tax=Salinibacter ruber TaxID=146919 RepID=UPI002166CA3C|nr:hypothetical protein [Salinibacter ruber]MCS3755073.1 hypothetical protein [Salinibacter ruber]